MNLHVGDHWLPFHGAFLFHEMQVHGYWPQYTDQTITSPIPFADWIDPPTQGGGSGDDHGGGSHSRGGGSRGHQQNVHLL